MASPEDVLQGFERFPCRCRSLGASKTIDRPSGAEADSPPYVLTCQQEVSLT
jgi:hypothetical protein